MFLAWECAKNDLIKAQSSQLYGMECNHSQSLYRPPLEEEKIDLTSCKSAPKAHDHSVAAAERALHAECGHTFVSG
jgi:hypothetical protein